MYTLVCFSSYEKRCKGGNLLTTQHFKMLRTSTQQKQSRYTSAAAAATTGTQINKNTMHGCANL